MTLNCSSCLDGVFSALSTAISEVNLQLPRHKRIVALAGSTLFGDDGGLDSLALANFIVIAEQKLDDVFGIRLDLTQDDPFTSTDGHFRTLGSLARYVATRIEKNNGG
jgi:acyl carrier protein